MVKKARSRSQAKSEECFCIRCYRFLADQYRNSCWKICIGYPLFVVFLDYVLTPPAGESCGVQISGELAGRLVDAGEEELTQIFTQLKPQYASLLTDAQVG
jgi:hypothetical protein